MAGNMLRPLGLFIAGNLRRKSGSTLISLAAIMSPSSGLCACDVIDDVGPEWRIVSKVLVWARQAEIALEGSGLRLRIWNCRSNGFWERSTDEMESLAESMPAQASMLGFGDGSINLCGWWGRWLGTS